MVKYAKDQLVEHIPTGCRGKYSHSFSDNNYLAVCHPTEQSSVMTQYTYWKASDCRPVTESTPQEPTYKYLSLDMDGVYNTKINWWADGRVPPWSDSLGYYMVPIGCPSKGSDWGVVKDGPDWIKPGQLWERMTHSHTEHFPSGEYKRWNGHWWKLIEDHDKRCETCKYHHISESGSRLVIARFCTCINEFGPNRGQEGCNYERS